MNSGVKIDYKKKYFEFLGSSCLHETLHFEGRNLAYLVCSCGRRWTREVSYSKNTRYTFFKIKESTNDKL